MLTSSHLVSVFDHQDLCRPGVSRPYLWHQKQYSFGFPALGRCNNMFVLAHSSAALFAVPLAARIAGALILLGSYFFPSDAYHASLTEWSR